MKLFSNIQARSRRPDISAFTLVEMMMSVGIYLFIFIGVMIAIQVFGLRVYTLAATKLSATAGARKALNQMRDDIREAKMLQVGNLQTAGSPTTFVAITNSVAQGGALQIFQTTNVGVPNTIYYLDTTMSTNFQLKARIATSAGTNTLTLSSYITNTIVFDTEDFQGTLLTNNLKNNQVYGVILQFYQWEYPIAVIGGVGLNAYDYYQLRTKICRRAID